MNTKILILFFTFSILSPNLSLAFTKSECRECTREVKDQVADIRKQFKLSKKADVVVLHSGEKGVQELKEIVEGNKIDDTDLVLVPIEGEVNKNGKKQTEGYVIVVKGLSKSVGGFLGLLGGNLVALFISSCALPEWTKFGIPAHYGRVIQLVLQLPIGSYVGIEMGEFIGKSFGKWFVTKLPQKEEAKKSTDQQPTPSTSSDAPASN